MIEELKMITELSDNLDTNGNIIGTVRSIRLPNTKELMDKINEIIEAINKITP